MPRIMQPQERIQKTFFMDQEQDDIDEEEAEQYEQQHPIMGSHFTQAPDENLLRWQLEVDDILSRIDRMLRGTKVRFKQDGSIVYEEATNPNEQTMNEYGVNEILRVVSMYLNRNTFLSNYDDDMINWKMYDFGWELNDLIYLKYREMGLDTKEKKKLYPMIWRTIMDTVHSAYLRALHGEERRSLHEVRRINQHEHIGMQNNGMMTPSKERSLLNPMRYLRGAYK